MTGALRSRIRFVPASLRGGKLFINLRVGSKILPDIIYDSGASLFSLVVDRRNWLQLSGLSHGANATARLQVSSWGQIVTMLGAPAKGDVQLGNIRVQSPLIFYIRERPDWFEHWKTKTNGLMGNALFKSDIVVLKLGQQPRFGVIQ